MPVKHQPDRVYLRKVRIRRIHIFTAIQVICLAILWAIKATPAGITFPLMVSLPVSSGVDVLRCKRIVRKNCLISLTVFLMWINTGY